MALRKRKNNQNQEKDMTQSKFYEIMDWFWKLFVINTLTLITTLGIITFVPGVVAAFRTLKSCKEDDETHYISAFFNNFRYSFKDTIGVGIVVLVVMVAFGFAFYFYSTMIDGLREEGGYPVMVNIYSVLLALTFFFVMLVLFGLIQIPMVVTYFHFRFIDKIKFSFYMGFRYFGISMLEFLILLVDVIIVFYLPYYVLVMFFSLPIYLIYLVSRSCYWTTANMQLYNDDEQDKYDIQGKTTPRETYEDKEER